MKARSTAILAGAAVLLVMAILVALPSLLVWEQTFESKPDSASFPVSVDPTTKTITENPDIESMLVSERNQTGAVINAVNALSDMAAAIVSSSWYQMFAASDIRAVVVDPGSRKEEIAVDFGKNLGWSTAAEKSFLASDASSPLAEGEISPGTYILPAGASGTDVRSALNDRFGSEILSHYSSSTAEVVPLDEALTIASMIERETNDWNDMRTISGIIWNRIFAGMKLQIDATVQYAKANKTATTLNKNWWPALTTNDKYIKSPYNTYLDAGLPPAPISNPSVAAVLAALNPTKTSCLFYFHDQQGGFHCSDTYAEHVALLKKYYGQGK